MKLTINPIIEDYDEDPIDISKELSGRVIYQLSEIDEEEIKFYCGPETTFGAFEDSYDCGLYTQLEELLEKFDTSIGAAENFHTISVPDGVDANKVWEDVKTILENSGAVESDV